jgi:electron-transferring-flavoprotein dehydrogenase
MTALSPGQPPVLIQRQRLDVDIVCVGFGPAMGGFLTTLSRRLVQGDGTPALESAAAPGLPLQVVCYERADDLGFGVSGLVTRARGLRASFPDIDPAQIPLAAPVTSEKMIYLLDPIGASRRSPVLRLADRVLRAAQRLGACQLEAVELPWTPDFLHKRGGLVLSLGQFMQWVGGQVQASGAVQLWPGTPVAEALFDSHRVVGVRLLDQGVDPQGRPGEGFLPGSEIHAALTVVGDGPVGPIGRQLDQHFGLPPGRHQREWALGMKMVVDLPETTKLQPGSVLHTLGFPEPEVFGFLYVHPDRVASLGIFVPSWFDNPARTAYRYLQHWMLHPYLWRHLAGARLRSWGAKSIAESGRRGEPHLVGDGFARIGESSASTNVLTASGVDEAWVTGAQLAEAVLELLADKRPFTRENLEATYVRRRRASWLERESRIAEHARDGFQRGVVQGLVGMVITGLTGGRCSLGGAIAHPRDRLPALESYYRGRIAEEELARLRQECAAQGVALHDTLMERCGWPAIPYDGRLLMSQQEALLLGGKVQAPPGCADHVVFLYPRLCASCATKLCVEVCSGQAITPGANGVPVFDREKCVHCGACCWNCPIPLPEDRERSNLAFRAGAGGLHSAEN